MTDNRKEQEREELHRTIWGIANDLRGSVDGWDFKQYVLGMLFYRYIVFCKAVSAAMLCAASTDKGGGQTAAAVHTAQKSTADTIQAYRRSESGADSSGTDSSGINTACMDI